MRRSYAQAVVTKGDVALDSFVEADHTFSSVCDQGAPLASDLSANNAMRRDAGSRSDAATYSDETSSCQFLQSSSSCSWKNSAQGGDL